MELHLSRRKLKGGCSVPPGASYSFPMETITVAILNKDPDRKLYYRLIP